MLRSWALGGLCVCVCALVMAAAPFDPLPPGSGVAEHLAAYQSAGLLGAQAMPVPSELSRLEAALLVQRALSAYGAQQLAGDAASLELQAALEADSSLLAAELALIGSPVTLSMAAAGATPAVAAPEVEAAAVAVELECCPDCGEPVEEPQEPADPCAEPELSLTPYGDVAIQLRAGRTAIATGGNLDVSDLTIYWGEIGVDAEYDNLLAHVSTVLSSTDNSVDLHEAYGQWADPEGRWALRGGRILHPLGLRDVYFPTYTAASDLVYIVANSVGGDITSDNFKLTGYAFNPQVEVAGQNDTLSDYSVQVEFTNATDDDPDHYLLTAGYTSNVSAHSIQLAGPGPLTDRTPAGSLLGELVWGCGRHRAAAEYAWAFDAFAPADLDADADGAGDKPSALDLEYIYTTDSEQEYGLRFEQTSQFADYARTRWGVLYGQRLNPFATFRVELSRGEFDEFSTVGAESDTQLNAEMRIIF